MTKAGSGATDQPHSLEIRSSPAFCPSSLTSSKGTSQSWFDSEQLQSTDQTEIYSRTKKNKKTKSVVLKLSKLTILQPGTPEILLFSKTSPLEQCHLWLSFIHHDLGFDSAVSLVHPTIGNTL